MMKYIKTKCVDKHSMAEVAKILGVNGITMWRHMNKFENSQTIYTNTLNDSSVCYFCQNAPTEQKISEKTLQRRLDPIIQYVKQLAGSLHESDVYILCQMGKRICNLSGKRTLTFQKRH